MSIESKYREALLQAYSALKKAEARIRSLEEREREPVAVIGMSCRFPKATSVEELWQQLERGYDAVGEVPAGRWNTDLFFDADWEKPGKCYVREGGFLDGIDQFDPLFFNISPAEARNMDPQHRLLLEVVWETIESAGIPAGSLRGSRTGVFVALADDAYSACNIDSAAAGIDSHFITGNATSTATGRISYLLGLHGPCMAVNTACSSSLVAVALAVQSLRRRESDLGLAGGVNLILAPFGYVGLAKMRALSPDGRCRSFDAAANGYGRGEGCGVVLLKRLYDAIRDGDPVLAVIRGAAINQDGTTNGLTAPNGLFQERVIEEALKEAGIPASRVGYIEGHGTGTPLGDPIELEAVSRVYRESGRDATPLYVGSVKANVGHLESAAGIAGLIKAVLCLMKGSIPPSPHFATPNPRFDWAGSSIHVPRSAIQWPLPGRRFAGVSSFGFSGTNVHLVLEEGASSDDAVPASDTANEEHVLFLSAKTEAALKAMASNYVAFLSNTPAALDAICHTASSGRDRHSFHIAVAGKSKAEISGKLSDFVAGRTTAGTEEVLTPGVPGNGTDAAARRPRVMLPTYPFQRKSYWVDESETYQTMVGKKQPSIEVPVPPERHLTLVAGETDLLSVLVQAVAGITEIPAGEIDTDRNFFELGMDSIMIIRLRQFVSARFGVDLEMTLFYQEVDTLQKLREVLSSGSGAQPFVPFRKIETQEASELDKRQEDHLQDLIRRHNERTAASKAFTQQHRMPLANNRNIAGFRPGWKEMTYPVVADRAEGARIQDIAGNEFVDFTMGFGACLFGHRPRFITEAVKQTLESGTPLGPMSPFAGKLAEAVCEMTGSERVAFYNSGTEAVMVALRLARTATGRSKIVLFSGSYHGTFDGILAKEDPGESGLAHALAPGIPEAMLSDVFILPYGDASSLDFIHKHGSELAAVLVEPVQSRRPDFQPAEFLAALREITGESGSALIFDEVITGFRCAPGGAQAWFGVRADLATYGKVLGGGLPIGLVGGRSDFMDGVDGGMWTYGDTSFPGKRATFVAGTFCHHPLAMTAGLAVVEHLRSNPRLQEILTARTAALCSRLNAWFDSEAAPIRMVHFSSLFRFVLKGSHELLFPHLLEKGIYIWEGRNCFLSTAHTDADLDLLVNAVQASVRELTAAGYIRPSTGSFRAATPQITRRAGAELVPASPAQRAIWLAQNLEPRSADFNLSETFLVRGPLDTAAFARAVESAVSRHESLRTAIVDRDGQPFQKTSDDNGFRLRVADWRMLKTGEVDVALAREVEQPFRLSELPLIRALLFSRGDDSHGFNVTVHHIVCDGWSMDILFEDILEHYKEQTSHDPALAPLAFHYRDFSAWQETFLSGDEGGRLRNYWLQKLDGWRRTELPRDFTGLASEARAEDSAHIAIAAEQKEGLTRLQGQSGSSLFMLLSALAHVVLFARTGQEDLLVGSPVAGRLIAELDRQVGLYINLLPLRTLVQTSETFWTFLMKMKQTVLEAYDHQQYPYALLLEQMKLNRGGRLHPLFSIEIALENFYVRNSRRSIGGADLQIEPYGRNHSIDRRKFDIEFRFIERPDAIELNLVYDPSLYRQQTIKCLADELVTVLEDVLVDPHRTIAGLCANVESLRLSAEAEKNSLRRKENLGRLSSFKTS